MQQIIVSPTDVSLFNVAARVWSDATAWLALANANQPLFYTGGVVDPYIYGVMTITIPDWDPSFSGGAPS